MHFCNGAEQHAWADADDAAKCCNGYERAVRIERDTRGHIELTYYWRPTTLGGGIAGGVTPPAVLTVVDGSGGAQANGGTRSSDANDGWWVADSPSASDALRHVAFFQVLGEQPTESAEWQSTSAGLVVLRLVDRWVWRHIRERAPTFAELVTVRRTIARLPAGDLRDALEQLAAAASVFSASRTATVNDCLVRYAQVLQDAARWGLAADVYDTVIVNARSAADSRAIAGCAVRSGFCLRMLGKLDEATAGYQFGLDVATETNDRPSALLARIGLASVAAQRGRLPDAVSLLDAVIAEAAAADLPQVRASALHDRGGVAVLSGEYEAGVVLLYEAFSLYRDVANRDRALNDLATALANLGLRRAAHDAYFVIHSTSGQRDLRWWAGLNLMRMALRQQDEEEFERYRRELEAEPLTGTHAAHFALFLGEGHARFGRPDCACAAFQRAIELARQFRLQSVLASAEAARGLADGSIGGGRALGRRAGSWSGEYSLDRGGPRDATATAAVARVVSAIRALAGAES